MLTLNLLCAGAAQGLVKALQERFRAETGAAVQARFGAVGAMREALFGGEPCDVMVLTQAMVDALTSQGFLRGGTCAPLGRVRTGIAVRSGQVLPDVSTADGLRSALLAADAIFFPDPERATAGIHFAGVMRELGVHEALRARLHSFPNGATSMRELAASPVPNAIGCTQITEIRYSAGVELAGPLPSRFELATTYAATVCAAAAQPELAARFIALMAGSASSELRRAGGFEF